MTARKSSEPHRAVRLKGSASEEGALEFLGEEPLLIRVNDEPYLVVMRTPGGEVEQALGFCLGEGIVDVPEDIQTVGYDELDDPNVVDVWLEPRRLEQVRELVQRKRYVSQSSCGICGKQLIEHLHQKLEPAEDRFTITIGNVLACLDRLDEQQRHYSTTRASHAAAVFDRGLVLLAFAEDVGRHNALDKAIGQGFMSGQLGDARLVALSSRNSYELIQKAARARIEVLVSRSRPTSLAVKLGQSLNMTLAFPDGPDLIVVCGEQRIRGR